MAPIVKISFACKKKAYRRPDEAGLDEIRLALNHNQPLGNSRFLAQIERKTGERRDPRPRGRPRLENELPVPVLPSQGKRGLWNK